MPEEDPLQRILKIAHGDVKHRQQETAYPPASVLGKKMAEIPIKSSSLSVGLPDSPDEAVDQMLREIETNPTIQQARTTGFVKSKNEKPDIKEVLSKVLKALEEQPRKPPSEAFNHLTKHFTSADKEDIDPDLIKNNPDIDFGILQKLVEGLCMCGLVADNVLDNYDLAFILRYLVLALLNAGKHSEEFEKIREVLEEPYQQLLDKL